MPACSGSARSCPASQVSRAAGGAEKLCPARSRPQAAWRAGPGAPSAGENVFSAPQVGESRGTTRWGAREVRAPPRAQPAAAPARCRRPSVSPGPRRSLPFLCKQSCPAADRPACARAQCPGRAAASPARGPGRRTPGTKRPLWLAGGGRAAGRRRRMPRVSRSSGEGQQGGARDLESLLEPRLLGRGLVSWNRGCSGPLSVA